MENNNVLTDEEKNKINKFLNSDYDDMKVENKKDKEIDNGIVNFDVMTDGYHFFVSCSDMGKICTQISIIQLEAIGVNFEPHTILGENCVVVNDDFLIYVQKNTQNPKYVPVLCLLKVLQKEIQNGTYGNKSVATTYNH